MEKEIRIALIGNPNVGKTSLFNVLTGSRQHVGNWPGVTIEKKTGSRPHKGYVLQITDLPGTYSLATRSPDEAVANDFITKEHPDLVVQVVDSTNLERNLYLTTQLMDMGLDVVLALNMSDMAESRGDILDVKKFSQAWGIPAVPISATQRTGINDLLDTIIKTFKDETVPRPITDFGAAAEKKVAELEGIMHANQFDTPTLRWIALRLMEGMEEPSKLTQNAAAAQQLDAALVGVDKEGMEMDFVDKRYEAITSTLGKVYRRGVEKRSISDSLDRVVTNKWLGIPIFLVLMWGIFELTFTVAAPFASLIDMGFAWLAEWIGANVQPDWLASLLGDGIIGGVGFVLVFVPNILVMFLMLSILEDSGYLARAAFIMDRAMSKLGLHGKSFIPMLLGFGCNVPALMASRTIEDKNSRLITILTTPYMSCSARLPVYILFAGIFFPAVAGTVVFGMYILGIAVAIGSALLFRHTILKGESSPFIMELPPYRMPIFKGTLIHMWERGSQYIKKAGTFILLGALIVWLLASFPWGVEYGSEASYAGALGHLLVPILAPLGFDWRIAVALVFGFLAKEIVVGALGVLYGAEEGAGLEEVLETSMTAPVALGLMSFVLIYTPCVAALGVLWRETRSWKWTLFHVFYSLAVAYLVAFVVFNLGNALM
ncbi:ferrous iron transport protein B [Methanomassiliicoccus luminyensis]|uniref:ferrous iron transport protein B n=1 Tax=Methanomassiliicoccus luminyensis TaxID=1080712 RepID=UPI000474FA80|nr:ferrous iron transport protein B [Methanomassiliicoccus luminyensis]